MPPGRIRVVAVLLVMASLSLWRPKLCVAQGNIYSGSIVSQDASSIKLNLNPCGKERLQTISPFKTMGDPIQATCPNGKKYAKVMVEELPPVTSASLVVEEFSGEMISESKDAVTLDLNPCGEKKPVTVSPYKKKSNSVDASCPNGKRYTKIIVEKLPSKSKSGDADQN